MLLRLLLSSDFAYWSAHGFAGDALVRCMGVLPGLLARASDAERERARAMMRTVLPVGQRRPGLRNDAMTRLEPLPLEKIDVPTLIISARDDLLDTLPAAEFMAARIPGARLVVVASGGHLLVDRQREIAACIADFMGRVTGQKVAAGNRH